MKTPGFDKKGRTLEWNLKNTEVLKKHGILKKMWNFYNVEFENDRGF